MIRTRTSRVAGRTWLLTSTRATSSGCTSLRSADAPAGGPTTGPSARLPTRGRRRRGGTRGSSTIRARPARISGRGAASAGTRASTHTACSSAGSTRPGTGPSHARTGSGAVVGSASSPTRPTSFGSCTSSSRRALGPVSNPTTGLRFDIRCTNPRWHCLPLPRSCRLRFRRLRILPPCHPSGRPDGP